MSFAEHRKKLYQSLPENTLVIAYAGIPTRMVIIISWSTASIST